MMYSTEEAGVVGETGRRKDGGRGEERGGIKRKRKRKEGRMVVE